MVFQKPNPFPVLSIYDNVAAGLKLNGMAGKEDLDEIVEESLKMAALWDDVKDKLNHSGASLSGGQQQRLCIARALAVKPEVILLTKTDLIDQKELKSRIKLFEKQKKTVLDVSILDDLSVKKLTETLVKILKKM